jgi:hypothetical protein
MYPIGNTQLCGAIAFLLWAAKRAMSVEVSTRKSGNGRGRRQWS